MPEPIDPEVRAMLRDTLQLSDEMRARGIGPNEAFAAAPPGPAGFLVRLAGMLADAECPCGRGLEHCKSDHDELERLGYL